MILEEILDILKQDEELKALLNPSPIDSKIYMGKGRETNCIGYRFTPISSDGVKAQYKIEINSISNDYSKANAIFNRVKSLLITIGDNKINKYILNVALNGGGTLLEEDNHIIKGFFIITSKERKM